MWMTKDPVRAKSFLGTFFLIGICMLAGCGNDGKILTDTGSGAGKQIEREEYLDTSVLEKSEEDRQKPSYTVYTLEKGSYTEDALNQVTHRAYLNIPALHLELDTGEQARFGEYVAGYLQYVEPGDVIATLYVEKDTVAEEEAVIRLKRLEERLAAGEEKLTEDLEQLQVERTLIYNDYERAVVDVKCRQLEQDWEREKLRYTQQIEEVREECQTQKKLSEITQIQADRAGFVVYETKYTAGTIMKDQDILCYIMSEDAFYVTAENQPELFGYGMKMQFKTLGMTAVGSVVSGGTQGLYGNLDTGETIFKLEFDESVSKESRMQIRELTMEGTVKTVQNVILVPREAVTVEGDCVFVTVLQEDGSLRKTGFIPGGSNAEVYWVLEGLTEGMKIVICSQ